MTTLELTVWIIFFSPMVISVIGIVYYIAQLVRQK